MPVSARVHPAFFLCSTPGRELSRTCEMLGIEPVPRERALGLIEEWTEVLSGRTGTDGGLAPRIASPA